MAADPTQPAMPSTSMAEKLGSPALVFLGINIRWQQRLADFSTNMALAEEWESRFQTWRVEDRQVTLVDREGYTARLADGAARFMVESGPGIERAAKDWHQLVAALGPSRGKVARTSIEAQYLQASDRSFSDLRDHLAAKLFNANFVSAFGAQLEDLAYVSDISIDGDWFQLQVGPVRAHEIRTRVAAQRLRPPLPAVALFYSVTSRLSPPKTETLDMMAIMQTILDVGRSLAKEVGE